MRQVLGALVASAILVVACSSEDIPDGELGRGPGGAPVAKNPGFGDGTEACSPACGAGMVCDGTTRTCVPSGAECGGENMTGSFLAPNMLLVLDRSCSMT